ncbi:hypothetical protein BH24ACT1_BH24ACT1_11750 [soil metagenome]
MLGVVAFATVGVSGAGSHPVGLGTADPFAVLAGAGVTDAGSSTVNGDLGTCPTTAITGFPPGVVNGTIHAGDEVCFQAQADLTSAYNDAAGRAPTTTYAGPTDLGGETLVAGVYNSPESFAITGTLTLDAQNDPDAVFIFQAGSTLITAPNSTVALLNGAQACNVFWQVGSSATLGVNSTFVGTILALTDITANTGAEVEGRLLARNGAVTLDSNVITRPECAPTTTTTTTLPGATTTTLPGATTTTLPGTTTTTQPPPNCECPPPNCECPTDCSVPDPCDPDPCEPDPCPDDRSCGCPNPWGLRRSWWVDQSATVVNSGSARSNTGGNTAIGNNSTNVVTNDQTVVQQQGTTTANNTSSAVNDSDGTGSIVTGDAKATGNISNSDIDQVGYAWRTYWRPRA